MNYLTEALRGVLPYALSRAEDLYGSFGENDPYWQKANAACEIAQALLDGQCDDQAVIVQGDPINGITITGPFESRNVAQEYGDSVESDWWIAALCEPDI